MQDFSINLLLDESPGKVFSAINNVKGWWSSLAKGGTTKVKDEFLLDFEAHWWAFRVTEIVPNKKVTWEVTGSYMPWNGEDVHEWSNTVIEFIISTEGSQTRLQFIHEGLVPKASCYAACSKGWTGYIGISLKNLITTGEGTPDYPY